MASEVRDNKGTRVGNAVSAKRGRMRRPPDAHPDIPSGGPVKGSNPSPRPSPTPPGPAKNWGEQWKVDPDTGEPAKPKGR